MATAFGEDSVVECGTKSSSRWALQACCLEEDVFEEDKRFENLERQGLGTETESGATQFGPYLGISR